MLKIIDIGIKAGINLLIRRFKSTIAKIINANENPNSKWAFGNEKVIIK